MGVASKWNTETFLPPKIFNLANALLNVASALLTALVRLSKAFARLKH